MLFENTLYYPTIEIMDEAWLKSAVLLWDHISIIVPESIHVPYRSPMIKLLESMGISIYV